MSKRTYAFPGNDPWIFIDITGDEEAIEHHLSGADLVCEAYENRHGHFVISANRWFSPQSTFQMEVNEVTPELALAMFCVATNLRLREERDNANVSAIS